MNHSKYRYTMSAMTTALKDEIYRKLQFEFTTYHLTGNIVKTMTVATNEYGYSIRIPAVKYSFYDFFEKGIIVYTPEKGSYANILDRRGGNILGRPTHHHKHYIEHAIDNGIRTWKKKYHIRIERIVKK